jgi:uncharacterized membrane protein
MALPFAFLISPLERVVRSDGTRILVSEKIGTKMEFKQIKVTMTSKLILLSAFWAIWSFFYRFVNFAKYRHQDSLMIQWYMVYLPRYLLQRPRPCSLVPHISFLLRRWLLRLGVHT